MFFVSAFYLCVEKLNGNSDFETASAVTAEEEEKKRKWRKWSGKAWWLNYCCAMNEARMARKRHVWMQTMRNISTSILLAMIWPCAIFYSVAQVYWPFFCYFQRHLNVATKRFLFLVVAAQQRAQMWGAERWRTGMTCRHHNVYCRRSVWQHKNTNNHGPYQMHRYCGIDALLTTNIGSDGYVATFDLLWHSLEGAKHWKLSYVFFSHVNRADDKPWIPISISHTLIDGRLRTLTAQIENIASESTPR